MTSTAPRSMLVGLEDSATAGVVAAAATHIVMDQGATALILLHVIDTHMVAGRLLGLSGVTVPCHERTPRDHRRCSYPDAAGDGPFTSPAQEQRCMEDVRWQQGRRRNSTRSDARTNCSKKTMLERSADNRCVSARRRTTGARAPHAHTL
jgi:hypothetical protein